MAITDLCRQLFLRLFVTRKEKRAKQQKYDSAKENKGAKEERYKKNYREAFGELLDPCRKEFRSYLQGVC